MSCARSEAGDVTDDEDEFYGLQCNMTKPAVERKGKAKSKTYPEYLDNVQRTAMQPKDASRRIPTPIIIDAKVNSSGSLGDFMSTTLCDQLKLVCDRLSTPMTRKMAVSGSQSKVNVQAKARLTYQEIDTEKIFDVINLSGYDLILGTAFMHAHKVVMGFDPHGVSVGSSVPLPLSGPEISIIDSMTAQIVKNN